MSGVLVYRVVRSLSRCIGGYLLSCLLSGLHERWDIGLMSGHIYWKESSRTRSVLGTLGFSLVGFGGKVEYVSESEGLYAPVVTYRIPYTDDRDARGILNRLRFLGYRGWRVPSSVTSHCRVSFVELPPTRCPSSGSVFGGR